MRNIKAKHLIEILIHLVFWIGVYYALISLTSSTIRVQINHHDKGVERIAMNSILTNSRFTPVFLALLFYGNIFWIFKKVIRHKNLWAGIAITAGWFILTFAANYTIVGPKLNHNSTLGPQHLSVKFSRFKAISNHKEPLGPPLPDSVKTSLGAGHIIPPDPPFFDIGNNGLHTQLTMLLVFLVVAGLSVAYFFLKEWSRNELVRNQMQANQLDTEIKFLKSQINPHFLFNTLNNLFSMAQSKGNDDLADGISKLSGMMRYMIYDSNAESVPLNKEIAYLEDCITLNKLRYADDEVSVIFNYPAQPGNVTVAPMLFIPFVENAFKHGVSISRASGIDIAIVVSGQRLIFTSTNTNYSAVRKMTDEKSGIGLENVKRRLDLLYPGKHSLQLNEDDGKYNVKLQIDLE